MPTPRDRAWVVALALADSRQGFTHGDVLETARETFSDDAPSRGTISNTLDAMAELGAIRRIGERKQAGFYVEPED